MKKDEGALHSREVLPTLQGLDLRQMTLGELFLEAISTGVITDGEMNWVTDHQNQFSRTEEAFAQRLGRLLDEGSIQLGCRVAPS